MKPSDAVLRKLIERMNNLSSEEVATAMEKLPTDVLEWGVRFEALAGFNKALTKALATAKKAGKP